MKQLFFLIIFVSIGFSCFSQHNSRYYDSLARKLVERFTRHPDCDACDTAGIALIKLFKANDSVYIKVLYASEDIYNIERYQNLPKWISKYKNSFADKYSVLVPVYFRYEKADGDPPDVSNEQKALVKKLVKKYRRQVHAVEPVVIMGYAPVR